MAEEYNKIHALARARKVVMDKFGNDLLSFWPLADDTPLARDLLRQRVLVGRDGVTAQVAGMLDYGYDLGNGGYVCEEGPDFAVVLLASGGNSFDDWYAIEIPEGIYREIRLEFYAHIGGCQIWAYIAPANITTMADISEKAIASYGPSGTDPVTVTWTLPYPVVVPSGKLWLYVYTGGGTSAQFKAINTSYFRPTGWDWNGSSWVSENDPAVRFYGVDAPSWASYDRLTIGGLVNVDYSKGDGMFACIVCEYQQLQPYSGWSAEGCY